MAQDFKAAFYPGRDDKTIRTLEFDGVEPAAIRALNRRVEPKETEITELKKAVAEPKRVEVENTELKRRLDTLEKSIVQNFK